MSTSSKKNLAQYERLASTLRDRIAAGTYARGDKLPSEMELMDESGLSRSTVRHALKVLVDEGLVRTERGREQPGVFELYGADPGTGYEAHHAHGGLGLCQSNGQRGQVL